MRLTPIDIQQQQFRRAFRGLESREVQGFLDLLAQQMGEMSRENNELRNDVRRLERQLDEHRNREETLRQAMLTAQRAIDEIRDQAKKEAQIVVTEAEVRAEKILHNAHSRVIKVIDEINDLRRQRVRAVEDLRGILSTHTKLLETYDAEEQPEAEGTVTVFEKVRPPAPPSMCQEDDAAEAAG